MVELIIGDIDSLVIGAAIFVVSFIVLLILWSAFVRTLFSIFGKSNLYFIPKTLKELFLSVAFIIFLASLALAIMFIDRSLLSGELFKIWQVLVIFAAANIVARVVLTGIDVQHRKAKDRSGVFRSIGLLKGTVGLVLYVIAMIISIHVLSAEVGAVVTVIGLFIVVLIFVAAFDHVKSIIAGLQLGDYYVDIGTMLKIKGYKGFVDSIHGRSTLLKTIDGKTIVLPNSVFFNTTFEIDREDVSEMTIVAQVKAKEPAKVKEKMSSISSKVVIDREDMPHEFKPKVLHSGVDEGKHTFRITFKITPASDLRRIVDRFCTEFTAEFGEKLVSLQLED